MFLKSIPQTFSLMTSNMMSQFAIMSSLTLLLNNALSARKNTVVIILLNNTSLSLDLHQKIGTGLLSIPGTQFNYYKPPFSPKKQFTHTGKKISFVKLKKKNPQSQTKQKLYPRRQALKTLREQIPSYLSSPGGTHNLGLPGTGVSM